MELAGTSEVRHIVRIHGANMFKTPKFSIMDNIFVKCLTFFKK